MSHELDEFDDIAATLVGELPDPEDFEEWIDSPSGRLWLAETLHRRVLPETWDEDEDEARGRDVALAMALERDDVAQANSNLADILRDFASNLEANATALRATADAWEGRATTARRADDR